MTRFRDRLLAIVDTETTGLDPETHTLLEVGVILVDQRLQVLEEYSAKLMPTEEQIKQASQKALEVNRWDRAEWERDAVQSAEAATAIAELTQGAVLVGHNVQFDIAFLENWLAANGQKPAWHYHNLDTKSVVWPVFIQTPEIPSVKLDHLCEHFNIQIEGHRALNDCRRVLELLRILVPLGT